MTDVHTVHTVKYYGNEVIIIIYCWHSGGYIQIRKSTVGHLGISHLAEFQFPCAMKLLNAIAPYSFYCALCISLELKYVINNNMLQIIYY